MSIVRAIAVDSVATLFAQIDDPRVAEAQAALRAAKRSDQKRSVKARYPDVFKAHPATGMPFDTEHSCSTCAFKIRKPWAEKSFLKCEQEGRIGGYDASDIRAWWPACSLWQEARR